MKIKLSCLVLVLMLAMTGHANAMAIDYVFNGTGSGDLNGTTFTNVTFNVTYIGDTSGAFDFGGGILANNVPLGSFSTPTLSANFGNGLSLRLNQDPSFSRIGFGQNVPAPTTFVEEATENSAFNSYDLKTAFPLTVGTPAAGVQTFVMAGGGELTFTSISAMSFQAVTPNATAAPLPSSFPMFAAALAGLALLAYQRRRA